MFYISVLHWFHFPFPAFRLMISLAAPGLMGKRMDLQQQPHSLIEYGNNGPSHLDNSSPFADLAWSPICSWCLFVCASPDVSDSRGETAFGKGAGAGSQTEEPAAISTTDYETSLQHQHKGNASVYTARCSNTELVMLNLTTPYVAD